MAGCEAVPLEGRTHSGTVRDYVRICPAGHFRAACVCGSCAGDGAVLCGECPGGAPALLIRASTWSALLASAPERAAPGPPVARAAQPSPSLPPSPPQAECAGGEGPGPTADNDGPPSAGGEDAL